MERHWATWRRGAPMCRSSKNPPGGAGARLPEADLPPVGPEPRAVSGVRVQPLPIDSCEARPRDLIERIASALPQQVRADYYREMAHCRVLPESDEMLRILRAMQFLALLIEQAPGEVAGEREKLTRVLQESVETVSATNRSAMEYLRKLEERIVRMPLDVSEGLQPRRIAELISNDLQRHLADVPQTVETLAGISYRIN